MTPLRPGNFVNAINAPSGMAITAAQITADRLTITLIGVAEIAHRLVAFWLHGRSDIIHILADRAARRVIEGSIRIGAEHLIVNRMVARVVGLLLGHVCLLMSCPTTPETNAKHARWLRNEFQ